MENKERNLRKGEAQWNGKKEREKEKWEKTRWKKQEEEKEEETGNE